jgi:hypothetical protein
MPSLNFVKDGDDDGQVWPRIRSRSGSRDKLEQVVKREPVLTLHHQLNIWDVVDDIEAVIQAVGMKIEQ